MYITDDAIKSIQSRFGVPETRSVSFEMGAQEFNGLKRSQKDGRSHDVTLFIRKDSKFVVIAKHFYPKGLFRSPSGGILPGEDFEAGALREAYEETGCKVALRKFLLSIDVRFSHGSESVEWKSYVFLADYISGDMQPIDKSEVRETGLITPEDFEAHGKMMEASNLGGFHYRAYLQSEVMSLLNGRR